MEKKTIRVGLIGAGFMAKAHSNAFHTIPYIYQDESYDVKLAAIGATTEEKAKTVAARYGYEKACVGWEAIVQDPEIDLVDVCVSDVLHKPIALAALKAGKHVLCEKPLAMTAEDARLMRDEAERANTLAMCGFNYRFVSANG